MTEGPTGPTIPNPGSAASELTLSISQTWAQEPSGYERWVGTLIFKLCLLWDFNYEKGDFKKKI